jgi:four helix bundle protein
MFHFENLIAFQKARVLVNHVYDLQMRFPKEENYALGDQVRRAAVSITSNVAEGMGRFSLKEQVHFIEISFGSLMEVYSQLLIAMDRHYISQSDLDNVSPEILEVSKLLSGLRLSLIKKQQQTKS